ncbi:hypothetical protein [Candidatus Formimonas warabiya]|uniref:Lipoprotein n=1 Tax=Formimonas warabiya TaxID=1761012 RepID=A0A3G1KVX5_FORW1|nr:hypothetical protein [Candidatus Formimonas warabiya]ATW26602.1 hypothetical protein DCMF_19240 [Candidatus Formimonas warabiya]
MKRGVVFFSLLVFILIMAGCGAVNRSSDPEVSNQQNEQYGGADTGVPPASEDQTPEVGTGTSQSKSDSGVVAKSHNTVSSQEKEEVLKELDQELDSLFSSMEELEDVEDTDLEFD